MSSKDIIDNRQYREQPQVDLDSYIWTQRFYINKPGYSQELSTFQVSNQLAIVTARAERRIKRVKREARSELSSSQGEWKSRNYSQQPQLLDTKDVIDTVPRIHVKDITTQEFFDQYEKPGIPVIIQGLMDDWPAMQEWTVENLLSKYGDHKFKNALLWFHQECAVVRQLNPDLQGQTLFFFHSVLGGSRLQNKLPQWMKSSFSLKVFDFCCSQNLSQKVGSDDDGYAVRLKFKYYMHYVSQAPHKYDDSPLYIFDGTFGDKENSKTLEDFYTVPEFFKEDLYRHVGENRRPPYKWFVMGPARSGSFLHQDPLATSAWNAVVRGTKRWALFPPGTPQHIVAPKEQGLEREGVDWFAKILPRTRQKDWPIQKPFEAVQKPGEIIFVPGGWWHAVLNLDLTIAVTQNLAQTANFQQVWRHSRVSRPKMSQKWLQKIQLVRQDLYDKAQIINTKQDFQDIETSSSSSSSSEQESSLDQKQQGENNANKADQEVDQDTTRQYQQDQKKSSVGAGNENSQNTFKTQQKQQIHTAQQLDIQSNIDNSGQGQQGQEFDVQMQSDQKAMLSPRHLNSSNNNNLQQLEDARNYNSFYDLTTQDQSKGHDTIKQQQNQPNIYVIKYQNRTQCQLNNDVNNNPTINQSVNVNSYQSRDIKGMGILHMNAANSNNNDQLYPQFGNNDRLLNDNYLNDYQQTAKKQCIR